MSQSRLVLQATLRGEVQSVLSTYVQALNGARPPSGAQPSLLMPLASSTSPTVSEADHGAFAKLTLLGRIALVDWRIQTVADQSAAGTVEVVEGLPNLPLWRRRIKAMPLDRCTLVAEEIHLAPSPLPVAAMRWIARQTWRGHLHRVSAILSKPAATASAPTIAYAPADVRPNLNPLPQPGRDGGPDPRPAGLVQTTG